MGSAQCGYIQKIKRIKTPYNFQKRELRLSFFVLLQCLLIPYIYLIIQRVFIFYYFYFQSKILSCNLEITTDWSSAEGFHELFNNHYSRMVSYAFNFLKEQEASEEVAQEVFFQLWKNRTEIKIQTSIDSYLYRSVRNRCINLIKHIEIRETYKEYNNRKIEAENNTFSDILTVNELDVKIRKAIDAMPSQRRKIFLMSRYDELSYAEIAEKLGLSKKTIEKQISNALQYLRIELKDYLPLLLIFFQQIFGNK